MKKFAIRILLFVFLITSCFARNEIESLTFPSEFEVAVGEEIWIYIQIENTKNEAIMVPDGVKDERGWVIPSNYRISFRRYTETNSEFERSSSSFDNKGNPDIEKKKKLEKGGIQVYKIKVVPFDNKKDNYCNISISLMGLDGAINFKTSVKSDN